MVDPRGWEVRERERLDHTYEGGAYPTHWGGRVEWDQPVELSGRFRSSDFQDGAGILLTNGDCGDLMGWLVLRRDWPKVRLAPVQPNDRAPSSEPEGAAPLGGAVKAEPVDQARSSSSGGGQDG